jgi:hypothetical protein
VGPDLGRDGVRNPSLDAVVTPSEVAERSGGQGQVRRAVFSPAAPFVRARRIRARCEVLARGSIPRKSRSASMKSRFRRVSSLCRIGHEGRASAFSGRTTNMSRSVSARRNRRLLEHLSHSQLRRRRQAMPRSHECVTRETASWTVIRRAPVVATPLLPRTSRGCAACTRDAVSSAPSSRSRRASSRRRYARSADIVDEDPKACRRSRHYRVTRSACSAIRSATAAT